MKRLLLIPMFALAACATVIQGPNETINVDSQPRGAAASITCDRSVRVTGTTPAKLVIPRKVDGCVVEVSGNDHTKRVTLHRGYSGRYWSNFAFLSTIPVAGAVAIGGNGGNSVGTLAWSGVALSGIGFIVDAASGSMYDRDVHDVFVDLQH